MFLWKNLIVVSAAFLFAFFILHNGENNKQHREWLGFVLAGVLVMLAALMLPVPYTPLMAIMVLSILVMGHAGVPIAATYFALTAITPMLNFFVSGVAGIKTLLQISSPLLAGAAVILVYLTSPRRFLQRSVQPADVVLIIFVLLSAILSTRGDSLTTTLRSLVELSLTLGGVHLVATRGRLSSPLFMLKIIAFIGGALALISIFEAVRIWPQFQQITALKGIPSVWGLSTRVGFMRALGPFTDPITFSLFLSMCFLGVWGLWIAGYRRGLMMIVGAAVLAGIVCTFSRTGGLALIGGTAILLLMRRRFSQIFFLLGGLVAGGLFLNSLLPEDVREGSTGYRLELIPAVLRVVRDNPLFGNNRATELGLLEDIRQGQGIVDIVNSYLGFTLVGGLVLLTSFLAIPLTAYASYRRWRRWSRPDPEHLIFGQVAIAQLGGLLLGLASTSIVDKNLVYVIMLSGFLTGIRLNTPKSSQRNPVRRPAARSADMSTTSLPPIT